MAGKPVDSGKSTTEIAYPALQDYFSIQNPTKEVAGKLADIWDFFGNKAENIGDLMYALRVQESRMPAPVVGQSRIDKIYQYVAITRRIESDERSRDSMLR